MSIQKWERAINDQTEMPSDWALQVAARCWCDDDTGHCVMDESLAVAFARRINVILDMLNEATKTLEEVLPHYAPKDLGYMSAHVIYNNAEEVLSRLRKELGEGGINAIRIHTR